MQPLLGNRFDEALAYASELHRRQVRKGSSIPYVAHLLGVCTLVLEYGGDEDQAIAGLLHDAMEDQGGRATLEAIRERFGNRVASIVEATSDSETSPKPPWKERKEAYLKHLGAAPLETKLVCACDKLHNAQAILRDLRRAGTSVWERFRGGQDGTLWYYRNLLDSLGEDVPVTRELRIVVDALHAFSPGQAPATSRV